MSLLIPTENDYVDAHSKSEELPIYESLVEEAQSVKDSNGKLMNPWKFEPVHGFFKQSDPATDDLKFNYAVEDFGINKPWDQIKSEIKQLNHNAEPNESYKLLFLARHGQGYHNLVVDTYGLDEWNRYWHNQERDGDIVIGPDPMLTDLGENQGLENNKVWKEQLSKGAPLPERWYVSPLTRSSNTLAITWSDIALTESKLKVEPEIKESLRETIGLNICDKRSPKRIIAERFSKYGYKFEEGFTEEDELYSASTRESFPEHSLRINGFLQFLFGKDWDTGKKAVRAERDTYISTTSHAGTIRAFITAIGHRTFTISTGGMIPILVKGTRELD